MRHAATTAAILAAVMAAASLASTSSAAVATPTSFTAAVAQHQVRTAATPDETLAANLAAYASAVANASAHGASLVVFPEFGLGMPTEACASPQQASEFCEPVDASYTVNGTPPCGMAGVPIASNASCMAASAGVWVAINSCESAPEGNYNVELVFDANGTLVAKYRKTHPWYTKCFLAPAAADLVSFTAPFFSEPIGVFTCFDILFPAPGPELVAAGVRHFVYSVAIPLIGGAAQEDWSGKYRSTLLGSNLQSGETGVYANGTRITPPAPAAGGDALLFAQIS